jgi:hypothetical protein
MSNLINPPVKATEVLSPMETPTKVISQFVRRKPLKTYSLHLLCEKQPPWPEKEFERLIDDVRLNGLVVPIKLLGGKIFDGRHRYKAWMQVYKRLEETSQIQAEAFRKKHPLKTQKINLPEQSARELSISLNNFSRTPSKDQLAIVAINHFDEHIDEYEVRRCERISQNSQKTSPKKDSSSKPDGAFVEIGLVLGVSKSKIMVVKKFLKNHPEFETKIFNGELTLSKAKKMVEPTPKTPLPIRRPSPKQVDNSIKVLKRLKEDIPELESLLKQMETLILNA